MFRKLRTLFAVLAMISSAAANADLAIIVHPDYQGGELDQKMIKEIFLGTVTEFPSGHTAIPANHSEGSADRKHFFEYVLEMGESQHKRYWSRKVSAGKKGAPVELDSYVDVLNWVAKSPLGISYIDKSKVNDSVKVIYTVLVFDDL
jgi:ABC-type phosphate transport system substrate-binding protein